MSGIRSSPSSLYQAMDAAKDLALAKMRETGALRYMLPGMTAELERIDEVFGGDPWPYGVEANRPTLEALVRYMAEQSLIKAPIPLERPVRANLWAMQRATNEPSWMSG